MVLWGNTHFGRDHWWVGSFMQRLCEALLSVLGGWDDPEAHAFDKVLRHPLPPTKGGPQGRQG